MSVNHICKQFEGRVNLNHEPVAKFKKCRPYQHLWSHWVSPWSGLHPGQSPNCCIPLLLPLLFLRVSSHMSLLKQYIQSTCLFLNFKYFKFALCFLKSENFNLGLLIDLSCI